MYSKKDLYNKIISFQSIEDSEQRVAAFKEFISDSLVENKDQVIHRVRLEKEREVSKLSIKVSISENTLIPTKHIVGTTNSLYFEKTPFELFEKGMKRLDTGIKELIAKPDYYFQNIGNPVNTFNAQSITISAYINKDGEHEHYLVNGNHRSVIAQILDAICEDDIYLPVNDFYMFVIDWNTEDKLSKIVEKYNKIGVKVDYKVSHNPKGYYGEPSFKFSISVRPESNSFHVDHIDISDNEYESALIEVEKVEDKIYQNLSLLQKIRYFFSNYFPVKNSRFNFR